MSKHKIVVGLGFGDEGKGSIVDYLTFKDKYDFVVRFSGGPQAAHNVVHETGIHHTFSQFGSGTFNGVPTILTRHMLVNPFNLSMECEALKEKIGGDPYSKLIISENSLVITPWHMGYNRLEELRRGEGRHGSCGQGVGVAQKFALDYPDLALRMKDLYLDRDSFLARVILIKELLEAEYGRPTPEQYKLLSDSPQRELFFRSPGNLQCLYELLLKDTNLLVLSDEEIDELIADSNCVWEGSQGALLDEWKGFHPYTTWSTTTAHTALHMLSHAGVNTEEDVEVIGVTRTYHTRHGAGPFPSEDASLLNVFPEPHNTTGVFQGGWRVGALDLSLLEYGVDANERVDSLAVTHCDVDKIYTTESTPRMRMSRLGGDLERQERLGKALMHIDRPWRHEDRDTLGALNSIQRRLGVPINIMSYGPKAVDKMKVDSGLWFVVQ